MGNCLFPAGRKERRRKLRLQERLQDPNTPESRVQRWLEDSDKYSHSDSFESHEHTLRELTNQLSVDAKPPRQTLDDSVDIPPCFQNDSEDAESEADCQRALTPRPLILPSPQLEHAPLTPPPSDEHRLDGYTTATEGDVADLDDTQDTVSYQTGNETMSQAGQVEGAEEMEAENNNTLIDREEKPIEDSVQELPSLESVEEEETVGVTDYDSRPIRPLPTPLRMWRGEAAAIMTPGRQLERLCDTKGRVRTKNEAVRSYLDRKRLILGE